MQDIETEQKEQRLKAAGDHPCAAHYFNRLSTWYIFRTTSPDEPS